MVFAEMLAAAILVIRRTIQGGYEEKVNFTSDFNAAGSNPIVRNQPFMRTFFAWSESIEPRRLYPVLPIHSWFE